MPGGLEASMPRCNVGWLGWLAWLAGLAGGLLLAGCCWLMGGSLTRSTLWGGRRILALCNIQMQLFIITYRACAD